MGKRKGRREGGRGLREEEFVQCCVAATVPRMGRRAKAGGRAALGENLQRKELGARPSMCGHERTQ